MQEGAIDPHQSVGLRSQHSGATRRVNRERSFATVGLMTTTGCCPMPRRWNVRRARTCRDLVVTISIQFHTSIDNQFPMMETGCHEP